MENFQLEDVIKWVTTPFFYFGQSPVTLSGLGVSIVVFFLILFISAIIQKTLSKQLTSRFKLDSGTSYALLRVLHYVMVVLAVVFAAQCLGINLGGLAVIFGFLSVGIGFGLQNIASNFISGLILLLERPIRVGDYVSVDGQEGKVEHINMRASVIHTLDNISIIVPNSKLIEGSVTNCMHDSDSKIRLHCPVGVAYGSNLQLVKQTLLKVADSFDEVLKDPEPYVAFTEFGDSSLNFILLVWTNRPLTKDPLMSDINFAIDAAFRKAGIEIPFPQRDLHLKMTPAVETLASKN